MPTLPRCTRAYLFLALALSASVLHAKRFDILVSAEADQEYVEWAAKTEYQTYHFFKGKFFGGHTRDKKLEGAQFEDLAESLADSLKQQGMYPESDNQKGDLLIMLSWGRTALDPDFRELQGITSGSAGSSQVGGQISSASEASLVQTASAISTSIDSQIVGESFSSQMSKNRILLGFDQEMQPRNVFGKSRDEDQWVALEEERYFVILNVFDYQLLLEKKELKQLWMVRYNTRAVGIGFETAYDSMNTAVSGVLGLNMNGIVKVKGDTKGKVSLGEIEVVEMGEKDEQSPAGSE